MDKIITIQINILESNQITSVVKTSGFNEDAARHLEVAGALFNLANQELSKIGTTISKEIKR